jgi:prophage DNA circulation protein
MAWEDDLEIASFRGVQFDVESISDSTDRRVVEHKFPYRDGGNLEDTGRDPRAWDIEATFFGADYLQRFIDLMRVADEGATGPFVHPVQGTFDRCKVISVRASHEAQRRDSVAVSLQLKEDATDTVIPDFSGVQAAQEDLTTITETVVSLSEELVLIVPANETNWLDLVNTAVSDAADFVEKIDELTEDLETRFEQMRKTALDAIDETVAMADRAIDVITSDVTPIVQNMQRMILAGKRMRERAERVKAQVVELPIVVTAPLTTIALRLYGDPAREDDLIRINNIRNPFLTPPGTRLRVFSE